MAARKQEKFDILCRYVPCDLVRIIFDTAEQLELLDEGEAAFDQLVVVDDLLEELRHAMGARDQWYPDCDHEDGTILLYMMMKICVVIRTARATLLGN